MYGIRMHGKTKNIYNLSLQVLSCVIPANDTSRCHAELFGDEVEGTEMEDTRRNQSAAEG